MQNYNNKKRMNKNRRNNTQVDGLNAQSNALTKLPRSVTNIVPDRMYTKMFFRGYGSLAIPLLSTATGARYRPTSAFDVDPLLGSTATPGFSEWAAFYSNYRVTSSRAQFRFNNTSTVQGAMCVLVPLNVDPGASPGVATINTYIENPYCKVKTMGLSGSPSVTLTSSMSTEKIFGSKMVYFDDNFQSLVTTNPTNNWYWAVGVLSPLAPVGSPQLINVYIDIEMGIEFFSRKILSS